LKIERGKAKGKAADPIRLERKKNKRKRRKKRVLFAHVKKKQYFCSVI
jgi:hypothetical protein